MNAGKLVTDITLQEKVWWDKDIFKKRNIRVYILRLKESCKHIGLDKKIISVHGEGYMLK
jgi:DNA-binding response OmpR family regulator